MTELFAEPGFTLLVGAVFGSLCTSVGIWIGGRRG